MSAGTGRPEETMTDLPHVSLAALEAGLVNRDTENKRKPNVLLLYGSLRGGSRSRMLTLEAARLLRAMGAATEVFDPSDLPHANPEFAGDPRVRELRELCNWSDAQVWCSPELHGSITGIMKSQLDWLPLELGSQRPTAGRTLAVMQLCGGDQSYNAVNQLRLLGRWMHMIVIPSQLCVPRCDKQFDAEGRMLLSRYYDRLVDVLEELVKFTLLLRDQRSHLADRYSDRIRRHD
ncbi:MAG: arsenical resistance protein ArsH [Hyphomicrobiaceae bacterium]|nr:arsenical resistance protein ArsH [Hyphomicrobiaceae bacterium]